MKINVTENKVSIKEEQILNENEYNIHKIQFDFSSEYTDDLVKVALFSIDNHTYKKIISNNECDIPPEVLTQRGYSILGVYAYKTEQDTLVLRYSPSPTKISVYDGSYKADAENSEPITPSEIEQYQQILQNSLQQFQNQYNVLVEETEGDIQAIEDELQRKVDEGYFDGEDGFSPIANVIQLSNGVKIEIEDKTGRTSASVFNGYSPQRGVDYWTQEDKEEVKEEATQEIDGKIEEYNYNATEKLNQYNQNNTQKINDYNTNAEQKVSTYNTNAAEKLSAYNTNATEKFNDYNSNAEQKETNYNTNASQKVESFNTNANSKLSEYNSNAEAKKTAYDENATQKTNSFNTNATNKLTEYNTNHTEKMSAYNSNSTQKLNAFNENATQKTEDFDEHTEEIQDKYNRLKATLPTTGEVTGQTITLNKTAELEFVKPPLPMGNSEQEGEPSPDNEVPITNVTGDVEVVVENKNLLPLIDGEITVNGVTLKIVNGKIKLNGTASATTWISVLPSIKSGTTTDNQTPLFNSQDMNYTVSIQNIEGQISNASNFYFTMLINENQQSIDIMNRTSSTIDFTNKNLYAIWFLINNGTTFNNYEFNAQIEEGSTATSYIQHQGQTFTFPLGNEKLMLGDYLADDGIHHVRKQIVLDGSENWSIAADYGFGTNYTEESGYIAFRVDINHSWGVKTTTNNGNTFSNIAKVFSWFTLQNTPQIGFCIIRYDNSSTTTLWVAIPRSVASTVSGFITFLQNQNMIIENEIEESVYQSNIVPYTSAQQEVYNQIKQALSYEGQTNISSNQNAIFNVEAYQSIKLILEDISNAIVALGGV